MTASLPDAEIYQTTYRRDFSERRIEMAGPVSQPGPASVGSSAGRRPRRRTQRPTEGRPQSGGFQLPGRSLTVGPAPGAHRAAPTTARLHDPRVSEALTIDMPEDGGESAAYSQWLLSKLPEIVEKCCRRQEPAPRVIEVLPPPVRRKIRINVTSRPPRQPLDSTRDPASERPDERQDEPPDERPEERRDGSTEEFVLDAAGLRQVHRSRPRRRYRPSRRASSSSATSLESARRPPEGDTATAGLVRRVLEEMFGPRAAVRTGTGTLTDAAVGCRTVNISRACQTSPRIASTAADETDDSSGNGGSEGGGGGDREAAAQTEPFDPAAPPAPPARWRSPQPPDTSRCILDTLTESNHLLRRMAEFFRRAELTDRVTQRAETTARARHRRGEAPDLPTPRVEPEDGAAHPAEQGRSTQRSPASRPAGDWWFVTAPRGGSTARSDGGLSRGDGPRPADAPRHCSDSELSGYVRRYTAAAEQQRLPSDGCEGRQRPVGSPSPSPLSSGRRWTSPQLLELHSERRPYRPLVSPPLRTANAFRTAAVEAGETEEEEEEEEAGPRSSSPAGAACPPCSHRAAAAIIDTTDALLSYDPWKAIENDFKTLLN